MTFRALFPSLLFLLLAPAALRAVEPLPRQVWATLPEARKAARESGRDLVMFTPEDESRHQAALDFLRSVEGARVRSLMELWLPAAGDPRAQAALDEFGLRSVPALALLASNGKKSLKALLGEDCVPLAKAFERLFDSGPLPRAMTQAWAGWNQPIEPFLAFAEARKKDLGAAASEPFRTWLHTLLAGPDPRLKTWAATRLVEANASSQGQTLKPFPILSDALDERFRQEVSRGNRNPALSGAGPVDLPFEKALDPPMASLGRNGHMDPRAPIWPLLRRQLETAPRALFSLAIYALMAPELAEADRTWILRMLDQEGRTAVHGEALNSTLYWIATDWLILYGRPADWDAFQAAMVPITWDKAFAGLRERLDKVPGFWSAKPELHSMFCEDVTQEGFWEHPEACLAAWGVTREALVEFGMDRMKTKRQPPRPSYPEDAKRMGFSATLRLRMLVGADGRTLWVRPEPGYALSFFAPAGMAYAMAWQFEPARVAGVARPSQFYLNMPYTLKR